MDRARVRLLGVTRLALLVLFAGGCGTVIEPGHRGLLFDPRHGGLQREVLAPGWHRVGLSQRIDDFPVVYETRGAHVRALSQEGLAFELDVDIIYRPIVSELAELDGELGLGYADEVVMPESLAAVREVMAAHSILDGAMPSRALEDELEAAARRRLRGRHVELAGVIVKAVKIAPEIEAAIEERRDAQVELRRKQLELEREAAVKKLELEREAAVKKLELEREAARARLLDASGCHCK